MAQAVRKPQDLAGRRNLLAPLFEEEARIIEVLSPEEAVAYRQARIKAGPPTPELQHSFKEVEGGVGPDMKPNK